MYAVYGHGGSVLFAAAQARPPGICHLGIGGDLDPNRWPLLGDLDKTRQSTR